MPNLAETKLFSHCLSPLFYCAALNFNGVAATLTYQVVVMGVAAKTIDSFSIFSAQKIHNLVID
jgi:hypothetical protein